MWDATDVTGASSSAVAMSPTTGGSSAEAEASASDFLTAFGRHAPAARTKSRQIDERLEKANRIGSTGFVNRELFADDKISDGPLYSPTFTSPAAGNAKGVGKDAAEGGPAG